MSTTPKLAKKRASLKDAVCAKFAASEKGRVGAFLDRKLTAQTLVEPPPRTHDAWRLDLDGTAPQARQTVATIVQALVDLYRANKDTPAETTVGAPRRGAAVAVAVAVAVPPIVAVTAPPPLVAAVTPAAVRMVRMVRCGDLIPPDIKWTISIASMGYHIPETDHMDPPFKLSVRGRVERPYREGAESTPVVRTTATYAGQHDYALGPEVDGFMAGMRFVRFDAEDVRTLVIVVTDPGMDSDGTPGRPS